MPVDAMTLDEFKKAIAEREAKVDALEKRKRGARNFRLVVDLPLVGVPAADTMFSPVERTALARKGTIFYVKELDFTLSVVGTAAVTGGAVTLVIPAPTRDLTVLFEYRIRDTGSDRDWQNKWVPGPVALGANINGLRLGTAHAVVSGGSEIVISLRAQRALSTAGDLGLASISSFFFQATLSGVEVKI
jgi:hypothetical protein